MLTDEPSFCDHCGNMTYKEIHGSFETIPDEHGEPFHYSLCQCKICQGAVFSKLLVSGQRIVREEQLWPPPLALSPEAPEHIRKIYAEARLVMKLSPSSFVVQIGRAMEALVKDRNAKGHTLFDKINWLITDNQLPPVFGEMAHINRIFRNFGAHDSETDIKFDDVKVVDEFFKAVIEYVYVAPAKINSVQKLLQERI
jgi:hypothetical protein